jgi:hypothetical protein
MFLPCRPCCGLFANCGGGCRIPQQISVSLTSQGLVSAINWSITQAEIDTIEAFINGTYLLQYERYIPAFNREVYRYDYPDPPYDYLTGDFSSMLFLFNCSSPSVLNVNFCSTTSSSVVRRASMTSTVSTTAPSVTQYCSGTSLSSTIVFNLQFAPDTTCGQSVQAFQRRAAFQVSAAVSE